MCLNAASPLGPDLLLVSDIQGFISSCTICGMHGTLQNLCLLPDVLHACYARNGLTKNLPLHDRGWSCLQNAFAANDQQQQSSLLSSEPSDFHLPHVRANTPAASGAV